MSRILSVSYDEALLRTRELLLQQPAGRSVTSALGFTEALEHCTGGRFDLFVLGHSIPAKDKRELIRAFRLNCPAPILALRRAGETLPDDADEHVDPNDIAALLSRVDDLLKREKGVS